MFTYPLAQERAVHVCASCLGLMKHRVNVFTHEAVVMNHMFAERPALCRVSFQYRRQPVCTLHILEFFPHAF